MHTGTMSHSSRVTCPILITETVRYVSYLSLVRTFLQVVSKPTRRCCGPCVFRIWFPTSRVLQLVLVTCQRLSLRYGHAIARMT
jgi:hypothetical protein